MISSSADRQLQPSCLNALREALKIEQLLKFSSIQS